MLGPVLADHIGKSPLSIVEACLEASYGTDECEISCDATGGSQSPSEFQSSDESLDGSVYNTFGVPLTSNLCHSESGSMLVSELSYDEEDSEGSEVDTDRPHPLYGEYLSRLGDADLCREAYTDLINEHEALLEAQHVRRKVGLELQVEDQATLDSFYVKEAEISEELRRIEEDAERLRQRLREARLSEWEDEESDILQPSEGLEADQANCRDHQALLQQVESAGLLDIPESSVESRPSPDFWIEDVLDMLGHSPRNAAAEPDIVVEDTLSTFIEPNGAWLDDFVDTRMFSNDLWPDPFGFEMFGDVNDQHEPAAQTHNIEHLEPFEIQEATIYIDPCLTVMTQTERTNDVSPDLKETPFPLAEHDTTAGTKDFQSLSTPYGASSSDNPKDFPSCTSHLKIPLSPPQSPPSLQKSIESLSSPGAGTSSSNENPKQCSFCNRLFSRPSDLRSAPSFMQRFPLRLNPSTII